MTINVVYYKPMTKVIEVDDKFLAMTETGGWGNLSGSAQYELEQELLKSAGKVVDVDPYYVQEIYFCDSGNDEEMIYQN